MTVRDFLRNAKSALADCWPDKRDIPYMVACYGLLALLTWMLVEHEQFRALVFGALTYPGFWKIVCAGLLVLTLAAAYLFYREWKEPLT